MSARSCCCPRGHADRSDGAPTTCKGTTVTYDPEGRAVNFHGLVASAYTGDGLRGVKYAGGYTYFLYDGGATVCELSSSGAVTATDTFGPNGLLSRHTASGVRPVHLGPLREPGPCWQAGHGQPSKEAGCTIAW